VPSLAFPHRWATVQPVQEPKDVAPARAETLSQDERTVDDQRRHGPLGPTLSEMVIEQVLERSDARQPVRSIAGPTPAVSVTISARAIDLGAGPMALESLHDIAALAVAHFLDQGFLGVIRPSSGPTFLFPLPRPDDSLDEVSTLCRQLDDEQLRGRAVACAERFRAATERSPTMRELLVDVRLGEGMIDGGAGFVGLLLPASAWRPGA